jgi:hypothetical protein
MLPRKQQRAYRIAQQVLDLSLVCGACLHSPVSLHDVCKFDDRHSRAQRGFVGLGCGGVCRARTRSARRWRT